MSTKYRFEEPTPIILKMYSADHWNVEIEQPDFIRVVCFTGPNAENVAREFAQIEARCPSKL